jgi:hypothetical protein
VEREKKGRREKKVWDRWIRRTEGTDSWKKTWRDEREWGDSKEKKEERRYLTAWEEWQRLNEGECGDRSRKKEEREIWEWRRERERDF